MTNDPIATGEPAASPEVEANVRADASAAAFDTLTKAKGWLAVALGLGGMMAYFSKYFDEGEARKADQIARLKVLEAEAEWQAKDREVLDNLRLQQAQVYQAELEYWKRRKAVEFPEPSPVEEHVF